MRFEEALNGYIHQIGITAKDLADASGLSTAVISRYRSGERTPAPDCEPLLNLSKGLARLAQRKGMDGFTQPELLSALQKSLRYDEKEGNRLAVNFDLLINVLNLRSSDMARALNFDPSYLSRIRTGQRTPANSAALPQAQKQPGIDGLTESMPSRIALAALISDSPCVLKNTSRSAVSFSSKMRQQSSERVNSSPVSSFIRAICSPQAHPLPGRAISLKSSSTIIIFGLCFAIVANSLKKCLLKPSSYGQQTYSVLPFAMPTYCVKGDASSSG